MYDIMGDIVAEKARGIKDYYLYLSDPRCNTDIRIVATFVVIIYSC